MDEGQPSWSPKSESNVPELLFACPFYKNNPVKFGCERSCWGQGYTSIARMKQHLSRQHRKPIYCPNCHETFLSQESRDLHIRALSCDLQEGPPPEGLEIEHLEMIRRTPRGMRSSPTNQWEAIYRCLFPQVAVNLVPSPYYEPAPDPTEAVSKFLDQNLPLLVRDGLERRLATIGHDTSREDLVEIVNQAQKEVYQDINQSYGPRSSKGQATPPKGTSHVSRPQDDLSQNPIADFQLSNTSPDVAMSTDSALPTNQPGYDVSIATSEDRMEYSYGTDRNPFHGFGRYSTKEVDRQEPSDPHTKVETGANTPVKHEPPSLREARVDDVPFTDSGYGSVPGLIHFSKHEMGDEKANRVEKHSDTISNPDGSDADTAYSDSSTTLPQAVADKYVIDIFNIVNQRLDGSLNEQTLRSLSTRLPAIIKAFAVKLGSDIPDRLNFRTMHFVHKHHQYIVSQLRDNFYRDASDAVDLRRSSHTMPLDEKMGLWDETHNIDPKTPDPSECFQGIRDEEDITNDEDVADDEDAADEGGTNEEGADLAFSGYKKTIVESSAYEWLISSLVNEASFHWDEAQPRTMVDQIRQGILSQLPTGRISPRRPPDCHTVSFKIPKSSLPFLFEGRQTQSTKNPPIIIADRIVVISASAHSIQVSKVSQYMDQTWPLGGRQVLSVLQNLVNGTEQARTSSATGSKPEIEIVLKGFCLEAFVTGTSYSIAEYGEQLAWLTAALQPANSDLVMSVRPFMRRVDGHTPTREDSHSWVIEVVRERIDDADVIAHAVKEWQGESKNPVIVQGFPTMSRPENCLGIEVSSQLPASLLPSPLRESNGTRLLLNATGKVLQLFKHIKGVTVWHILGSPREICACRQHLLEGANHLLCLDYADLRQHRHVITECPEPKEHHKNTMKWTKPGIGDAETSQRECSLSEAPQRTPCSENATDSSDSLDIDMLSIPDSSEYGVGGPRMTDDAILAAVKEVASRLVLEYRQYTEQHNPANECPSNTKQYIPEGQQSYTTSGSSRTALGPAAAPAYPTNSVQKRPSEQDQDDGDGERTPARKKQKTNDAEKGLPLLLACVFFKQDPVKHSTCFGKKLSTTSRVKQHLFRNHIKDFYCEKCLAVFPNQASKRAHLSNENSICVYELWAPLDSLTSSQQRDLRQKSNPQIDESQKWFAIWDIVFPGLRRPSSPYLDLDLSQDLNSFREFSERRGPAMLAEVLRQNGVVTREVDEDLMQRATNHAIGSIFAQWMRDRAAILGSSNAEEPSLADASNGHQYSGLQSAQVSNSTNQSPAADSGVVLESQSLAGLAQEDTNLPLCLPTPENFPSDGRVDTGSHETVNVEFPAAISLSNSEDPSQLPVNPTPLDAENPHLLIQLGADHIDPRQLNLDILAKHILTDTGYTHYTDNGNANAE